MTAPYAPPSDFLRTVVAGEAPLADSAFAEANLRRLIAMTRDPEPANRDWATFLLAQDDIDTLEVREALLAAAEDEDAMVRAEAILGLTLRDKALALPLVRRELAGEQVFLPIFEAASVLADPTLAPALRAFAEPSGDDMFDSRVLEAIEACEGTA